MTKKRRAILFPLILAAAALLLTACASGKEETQGGTGTYVDYIDSGKVFAAQIGDVYGAVATDVFKAEQVQEFTLAPDMLEAVRMGNVDVAILDDAYVKQIEDSGQYPELDYVPVPQEVFVNMASNVFHTEELRDQFNEWFATLEEDGTFEEIYNRWIGVSLPDEKDIPRFELTGENGTLRVCNTGSFPPFSYTDSDNRPVGFDEEIISRFAAHLGMDIEYNMMSYDAVIPFVLSGKADMSACSFTVTGDRSENVIFGEPYAKAKAMLVIKKSDAGAAVRDHTAFAGKDIAVITGVLTVNTTGKIGGNPIEYNDSAAAAEDVRRGRVAGYMHALTAVQVMAAQMDGFEVIPVPKEIFSAQIGGISYDQAVIDRFNTFLAAIEADGTLADMQGRWFGERLDLEAPIPPIANTGANGVLEVAICSDSIPYVYVGADGEYSGFSVELALRFGAYEGRTIEFTNMDFGGLIPYVQSEKAEIGLANMAITEERKQSVLFTDPFFDEQHGILVLSEGNTGNTDAGEGAADTGESTTDAGVSMTDAETGMAEPVKSLEFSDFFGKTLGIPTGYVLDTMIEEDFSGTVAYYSETSAGIEDVRQGRIGGFMTDLSIAGVIVNQQGNDDLVAVPVPEEYFSGPLGAISMDEDMIGRFNVFLAGLEADGTLAEMQRYWIEEDPGSDPPMPGIPMTDINGVLKVAIGSGSVPFCYIGADGEIKGFCAELIRRFAAYEGLNVEFTTMEFSSLITYISSGKADLGIDAITITEERKQSVLFTDPFYYDLIGIVALMPEVMTADNVTTDNAVADGAAADNTAAGGSSAYGVLKQEDKKAGTDSTGIIQWIETGIERNLITDNRWKMIVDGLGVTMIISILSQLFGTAFGCFVCWLLTRRSKFVRGLGSLYCGLIHGTPIVVLLMITYYIIFGDADISNVMMAVAAFTMITGAGVAVNLKGAIGTVDPVEIEAARSIGFSAFKAFRAVTLPQAIRRALPGYTNGFVELVKATAIVGYIAIQDLTRAGDIIRSRTYDAYFPLMFVALIYLLMTTICVRIFKVIVRKWR